MKLRKSIRLIPVLLVLMLLITGCAGQKMLQHNGDTGNSGNAESSGNSGGPEDTGNAEKAGDTENTGNVGDAGDTGNTDAGNTDGSQADEEMLWRTILSAEIQEMATVPLQNRGHQLPAIKMSR